GDLKVVFEPNAEDEIWSNQQDWNLISWKLEKVSSHQGNVGEVLNWKLEAKAESTMAFELLKFIKSPFRGGLLGIEDLFNLILLIMVGVADEDM
nr:hypothetical protein [Tanacetum cinerariifolium]